jgi:hypothetical protein
MLAFSVYFHSSAIIVDADNQLGVANAPSCAFNLLRIAVSKSTWSRDAFAGDRAGDRPSATLPLARLCVGGRHSSATAGCICGWKQGLYMAYCLLNVHRPRIPYSTVGNDSLVLGTVVPTLGF